MKQLFFCLLLLCATATFAQDNDIKPAAKGVVYGSLASNDAVAISADELTQKTTAAEYSGRITGKVTEVCQAMGCWFKIEKKDGTALMVKTKDHGYFLPQNLVGKTVAVDGVAKVKEVTEAQRRHLAEDAGKTKADIEKIKGNEKEVQLVATGVQVLD